MSSGIWQVCVKHGWGNIEMWEEFKILLLCLISIIIASLTDSWFFICVVLFVLVVFLYDFDFTTGIENHAISKVKYLYLKVRNLYAAIHQREPNNSSFQLFATMNSVNKQSTSFDLSRFNKSGNALSPISNSSSSGAFSSRRLIQSRQTSTPLTRSVPWQKNSVSPVNNRTPVIHNLVTSRSPRYSLASLSPKSVDNETPTKPTIQTVTGPLLASTRFNVNLGTYTDSKSPGLASRVVQYHNELSGSQTSTHQAKYGSPGLFPIVQLYKKELPILSRSPRRCTVRIAPPDPVSYNSDHANTILRDSFVQNNTENTNRQNDTEINTRSVLEALKEISRKRIHTNDDIDDISKRQRKNSINSSSSSVNMNKDGKRMREDTPPKPKETCTTPVNSAPKRICVVNEIESSLSSSRLMRMQQGQKRKSTLNTPETNKQRRITNGELVSRETQTTATNTSKSSEPQDKDKVTHKTTSTAAQTESTIGNGMLDVDTILSRSRRKKKSNEIRSTRDIDEENSTLPFAKISDTPSKPLFSEAPLEIMKQNKLSIMLSALGGHEPEIIPLPDMTLSALKKKSKDNPEGTDIISKEVVSILSPKNKAKHDKHVTFAIPSSDTTDMVPKQIENASCPDVIAVTPITTSSLMVSSPNQVSLSTPSTSVNFSSPVMSQIAASNRLAFSLVSTSSSSSPIASISGNNFMFGPVSSPNSNATSVTTTTNATNIITSSNVDKPQNSVNKNPITFSSTTPDFNFGSNNSVKSLAFRGSSSPSNSVKIDANKSAVVTSATPAFQLPSTPKTPVISAPTVVFGTSTPVTFNPLSATSTMSQSVVNFGTKSAFTNLANNASSTVTSSINFVAPSSQAVSSLLPANPNFNATAVTSTTSSGGMFNFNVKSETKTTAPPAYAFGSPASSSQSSPKTGGFKFDLGKSAATTIPAVPKSDLSKSSLFGAGTSSLNKSGAFTFGPSNTTNPLNSGLTTITTNATTVFGIQTTTSNTPTFGTSSKTLSAGIFGTPSTTIVSSKMFGTPVTTSMTGIFGAATTASVATFGTGVTTSNNGTFGTPSTSTTTAAFGATNTTPNTGIFGNTPSSTFVVPKTSESTPNFASFGASGSSQNTGFGSVAQTAPNIGFGATKTTQSNAFGSTTPATTSNNFSFGTNSTTKSFTFGSTTATTSAAPMFGPTSSTPSTNLFGGNASSGFGNASGTSNTFGTPNTTSQNTFGQQSTSGVFGTAPSNFASGSSAPAFGANNNNNTTFGSSNTPSVFNASTQQPSTFGTGTSNQGNVFGMTNNNTQATNVFGAATPTNNNNAFVSNTGVSFGSGFSNNNNAQSSGIGNFGSPAAQGPSPSSGVFTFGGAASSSAATLNASNAFQFGTGGQNAKQSGFNFSANTNTPNINFGSATPSFSATPTPAFGSSVPSQFNAPTPATGMFNIGSGSTAPKQRPMIKARRRN